MCYTMYCTAVAYFKFVIHDGIKNALKNDAVKKSDETYSAKVDKPHTLIDADGKLLSSMYNLKLRWDLLGHSDSLRKFKEEYPLAASGLKPSTTLFGNQILIHTFHGTKFLTNSYFPQVVDGTVYRIDNSVLESINTTQYAPVTPSDLNRTKSSKLGLLRNLFNVNKPFNMAEQER